MKVAIVGGSIAGLAAGIALRSIGCDVSVYEKSKAPLRGRGGGLIVQQEMLDWMNEQDIGTGNTIVVPGYERQFIDQTGKVIKTYPSFANFTSWDAVFHQFKSAFPDDCYHLGKEAVSLVFSTSGAEVELTDGENIQSDLLIGADGVNSVIRYNLFPDVQPNYSGYVAWRGVIPETNVPQDAIEILENKFTYCQTQNTLAHAYFIPGDNLETEAGNRRINWVWYWNADEETKLPEMLSDIEWKKNLTAILSGKLHVSNLDHLHDRAINELPRFLSDIVTATHAPFIQFVFDFQCPGMYKGRTLIIGDSASIVRPHTASGTSKACGDAVSLAQHFLAAGKNVDQALPLWQDERMAIAHRLIYHGRNLAIKHGLGN